MRISVSQDEMNSVMSIALRAISSRSILPVLSGVRLIAEEDGPLRISTTDLEITLHCTVPTVVEKPGKAVVPAKLLGEVVKNLPNEALHLSVDQDENNASLICGTASYSIKGLPIEDYPQLPEGMHGKDLSLSGELISEAIRQVIKAVGRDEARPSLSGVLFSFAGPVVRIVATDSYRLAVKEVEIEGNTEELDVIIPSRAVEELGKLTGEETITISTSENQIAFKAGEVTLISRLIEGQFPKYQQLIPTSWETTVRFDKEKLMEAIRRVSIISPTNAVVRLVFQDSSIKVASHATDVGSAQDEVGCSIEGEGMEIAFSAQYLLDGLTALQGSNGTINMNEPLKPAVLQSEGIDDYLYLIMPIRLN